MSDGSGLYTDVFGDLTSEQDLQFEPGNPARILPLISGSGDRRLLTEWIDQQPEYEAVHVNPDSTSLTTAEFDLCILDEAALQTYLNELRDQKEATAPVLVPYLLLYPDQNQSVIDADQGELADSVLSETVDEIVSLPLKKSELAWRVKALLRLRSQSLQLKTEQRQLQRFKQAADAAGHAIYITNTSGTIEYVNEAFEEITGYDKEEAVGENPRMLKSGEMPESYYKELWKTVSGGEMWVEEVTNRRKNGEKYTAEQTIAPINGPEGETIAFVAIQQDITERNRRVETLRQYRQAIESSKDLITGLDEDFKYLFANREYRNYHGVGPVDITNYTVPEAIGEERFETARPKLERAMAGQESQQELTRTHPEKGERILSVRYFPLKETEGEIRGVGASMRDITERKENERHLETLIGNLPGIVYRCRNERGWPMEMIRGRSEGLTGYTEKELETGDLSWADDIIVPEDRNKIWSEIQTAVEANEPFEVTYRINSKSGAEKWVWEKGRLVSPVDSDESRLEGFISDITNQKRLEEDLREASEQYKALFTSIQDAILVADIDREIINCNPAFTDLFGYELKDIEGQHTKYVYASDDEFDALGDSLEGHMDDPAFSETVKYEKKSGHTFPGKTNVFYLRDAADEIIGFIGVIKDVSEIRDRVKQLQIVDRVLQHNFHNDLNVIQGYAETIETEVTPPESTYAGKIKDSAIDLAEKVDKQREITKFLSDPPSTKPIDISEQCKTAVDNISSNSFEGEISTSYPAEAMVECNEAVELAIEELLTNSIIHAESEEPQIALKVTASSDCVSIQVTDENVRIPGMERKVLTGEEELTPLYHGSGMGLWMVHLIVSQSGGKLEFEDNDSEGNVVTIHCPITKET